MIVIVNREQRAHMWFILTRIVQEPSAHAPLVLIFESASIQFVVLHYYWPSATLYQVADQLDQVALS